MELLETAKYHKGPLLISGYDSDLYNDLLRNWYRVEKVGYSQVHSKKKEILWMNFEPVRQLTIEEMMK